MTREFYKGNIPWLTERTIFCTVHGSRAYGTNTPASDTDMKGVCIPPREYYLDFNKNFDQAEQSEPIDLVVYSLQKFMKLASDCNPNIIEVLFTDPKHWVKTTPVGERLYERRLDFLSLKAKHTFSGYAISQLKRMKSHRAWLLDPPKKMPERADYGLGHTKKISASILGAYTSLEEGGAEMSGEVMELFSKERSYQTALTHYNQYMNWKKKRNAARFETERKYGYDCYVSDTEFLTESGWKLYDDIDEIDRLATVRQKTGQIEFQNYFDRVKKDYSGEILHFETQDSMCSVTPNHRMLVSPLNRSRANGFSTKYKQNNANWQIKKAGELLDEHRSYYHTRITAHRTKDNTRFDDELLWLVGAYVSEGCVGKRLKSGDAANLRITQKESGRQQIFLDCLCETTSMKKYTYFRKDKGWNELIYTYREKEIVKKIVDWCGEYSKNKHLPNWITSLSTRQANELLNVLIAGDGTERKYSSVYYTISPRLADDVQTLGIIAGRPSKIWGPYKDGMYQVYLGDPEATDTLVATENGHITKEVVSNASVVCFSVPNEILITRRKGKVAIQGNTKHAMHLVRLMRMCREIITTGEVVVNRPDAVELLSIRNGAWTYDHLIEWADRQDDELEALYKTESKKETPVLPKSSNKKALGKLCVELTEMML